MRYNVIYDRGIVKVVQYEQRYQYHTYELILGRYKEVQNKISALISCDTSIIEFIKRNPVVAFGYISFLYDMQSLKLLISPEDIEFIQLMSMLNSIDLEIVLQNYQILRLMSTKLIEYGTQYLFL